jgi:hypothetical protein
MVLLSSMTMTLIPLRFTLILRWPFWWENRRVLCRC